MVATYDASAIVVLPGLEAVRLRPGMYIGDVTDGSGMHAMLWEVVNNAIDEHLNRGASGYVQIAFDGARVSVEDDGRGIPVDVVRDGQTALEIIMTTLHSGAAWRRGHVHIRRDLFGTGVAPVCALSSELAVEVWRDGRAYAQRFARGYALGPLEDLGPSARTGTRVSFTPDFSLLEARPWDVAQIARRGRELAALVPGITVSVAGDTYCYPSGVLDHIRDLAGDAALFEPFYVRAHRDGIDVDAAIAWVDRDASAVYSFVNCSATRDGMHVKGLLTGLRAVLAPRSKALRRSRGRKRWALLTRGMIAIVHASLQDPRFGNPTRDWLANEEVEAAVHSVVETELAAHFERTPALLDWLLLRLGE